MLLFNLILLALGFSMLLYGLSARDEKTEENPPAPERHIALGVSFSERERLDVQSVQERTRGIASQQRKVQQTQPRSITLLEWLKKQILEGQDVR